MRANLKGTAIESFFTHIAVGLKLYLKSCDTLLKTNKQTNSEFPNSFHNDSNLNRSYLAQKPAFLGYNFGGRSSVIHTAK